MLKKLHIQNYALIEKLDIHFGPGLTILTGETGAGKSIIIGALSLLLGERAKTDVIRKGASMAVVEGYFHAPETREWQQIARDNEFSGEELLLRREIHDSGRSRAFVNDSPVSITLLSTIGDLLVDLHGQHAHQTLLKDDKHLDYLDNFGVGFELRERMSQSYKRYRSLNNQLETLKQQDADLRKKQELLEFQVQEIEKADPKPGEEEALEKEERILQNSEKLFQASNELTDLLYDGEGSVIERISTAESSLSALKDVDDLFIKWKNDCESVRITVQEMIHSLQDFVDKIEFNPERLEEIRERLGLFTRLKKKYGATIGEVLDFYVASKSELSQLESIEDEMAQATKALEEERVRMTQIAQELSEKRKTLALELESMIIAALEELGLKKGVFRIDLNQKPAPDGPVCVDGKCYAVESRGIDLAEFFISLNPGEDPKPLAKVASGGEISRIMLALKTVLAEADDIPVLVFDEIDTGISGRIASVVGKNLKDVAEKHQVVCITHLPQIASAGESHFSVRKVIKGERSLTRVQSLSDEERIQEIAKLIGGETVSESAIQSAKELLQA